jgi:hypothetical protein
LEGALENSAPNDAVVAIPIINAVATAVENIFETLMRLCPFFTEDGRPTVHFSPPIQNLRSIYQSKPD